MKFIFTLFFLQTIFLGNITAQNKDVLEGSNLLLFSFQEDSFLISGDSIYTVSDSPWTAKLHGLENLTYNFVSQGDLAYLVNRTIKMIGEVPTRTVQTRFLQDPIIT
jgi:hypothetical protein